MTASQETTIEHLPICPLSDLPRLLCGCPQHTAWAADVDDLSSGEVAYLKGISPPDPTPPRHHQITPVSLPRYGEARPWATATNVALPKGGRLCQGCGDRPAGDAFLCPECVDDLRVHLSDVPGLLKDLDVLANREAVVTVRATERPPAVQTTKWDDVLRPDPVNKANPTVGLQLTAAGYHRPLHVERAVNARRRLNLQVALATRTVFGKHAKITDPAAAARTLADRHLDTIANNSAGSDIARGMQHAHDRAMTTIDNVEAGVYLGLCDKCKNPMHADPDHAEHDCTRCNKTYDVVKRRESQRTRVSESLLSVSEIVDYSSADKAAFGAKVTARQLEGWIRTGRLVRVGMAGDEPTYRAGDVIGLVDDLVESRDEALPLDRVAELLDIPVKTLYRWQADGIITPVSESRRRRGRTYDVGQVRRAAQQQKRA